MTTQAAALTIPSNAKARNAALWALQLAGAAMFAMASFGKLTGDPMMVGVFDKIGIGQWFRFLTGGIELVSAALLLFPSLAGLGALLLVPTMIGAVASHLFILGGSPALPFALLIAMAVVAYGRRERTLRLLGGKAL